MKTTAKSQSEQQHTSAAAHIRRSPSVATIVDNRPGAATQRALINSVSTSPYITAQRKQLSGMYGEAVQRKGPTKEDKLLQGKGLKDEKFK